MTTTAKRRVWRRRAVIAAAALALTFSFLGTHENSANAMEDGKGFYPPGFRSSLSGVVPPPGTYVGAFSYYYTGDASAAAAAGVALDQLGNINLQADIDVNADIFIEIPNVLWVAPQKILGGNLGLAVYTPVGWQDISVDVDVLATLTLPNGRTFQRGGQFSLDDDTVNFGDPLLLAMLGWHSGNWHWNVSGALNVPIGAYDEKNIANMGFNRWAFHTAVSTTWLDPQRGHEASVSAGFIFNGENPDTNYRSGTEFIVEYALMQHFSKAFAIGLTGFHYQQVTGDSGLGATLGSFKGRTTGLGPNINYNFQLGKIPVSTTLRWLHEFNVKNRLEGEVFYFTAVVPLGSRANE